MTAVNPNSVVVLLNGSPIDMSSWFHQRKTRNEFMDWFVETHPYYEAFKKAYLKKVNEEKAPWERKEEV